MKNRANIILIIYFFLHSCTCYNKQISIQKRDAQIMFLYNLKIVKDYISNPYEWEDTLNYSLDPALDFLEEITSIKSSRTQNLKNLREPTISNYKAWKSWYEKNKERIYWDEKEKKLKLKPLN